MVSFLPPLFIAFFPFFFSTLFLPPPVYSVNFASGAPSTADLSFLNRFFSQLNAGVPPWAERCPYLVMSSLTLLFAFCVQISLFLIEIVNSIYYCELPVLWASPASSTPYFCIKSSSPLKFFRVFLGLVFPPPLWYIFLSFGQIPTSS